MPKLSPHSPKRKMSSVKKKKKKRRKKAYSVMLHHVFSLDRWFVTEVRIL